MDCPQGNDIPIGDSIEVQLGKNGNQGSGTNNETVWTSENGMWSKEASVDVNIDSNHEGGQLQLGNELPNKRSRYFSSEDLASSERAKAYEKLFHKTKLCCKFQFGTCPYYYKCTFAHGIEELRRPPPNWQDILAEYKEEQGASEPRLCGEKFNFRHNEKSEDRESAAICLVSGPGGGSGTSRFHSSLNASNWKTRICYRWEMNRYCYLAANCHFAHGAAELRPYGGQFVDKDFYARDTNQGVGSATTSTVAASAPGSSASTSVVVNRTGGGAVRWKGPNKISKVYGDWIDDL